MKKLLLFLLFLLLLLLAVFICRYCTSPVVDNKPHVPTTVCNEMGVKNTSKSSFKQCFRQNEFVVTFPDNADSIVMRDYLLRRGLKYMSTCPCSKLLQLWGGTQLIPDGKEPPPPPIPSGGNVVKNFIVMEIDSLLKSGFDTLRRAIQPVLNAGTPQVTIGIVDSGVDPSEDESSPFHFLFKQVGNPFMCLSDILKEGNYGANLINRTGNPTELEPLDTDGHGTFINGILAHKEKPPMGYTGTNSYTGENEGVYLRLLHARFVKDRRTEATLFDALCGVHYVLSKGAKVVNASWRSLANNANRDSMRKAFLPTLQAIKDANAILVTGAGNDALTDPTNDFDVNVFPASFSADPTFGKYVIAVGAWDLNANKVAAFSNQGKFVDIYAPGVDIASTGLGSAKLLGSGTSYATPFVSRLVAITLGKGVPFDKVKKVIMDNALNTSVVPSYSSNPLKMLSHQNSLIAVQAGIF